MQLRQLRHRYFGGNNTNTTLASEIPDAQNVTANRTTSLSANDSTAVSANGTQTTCLVVCLPLYNDNAEVAQL